jgi:CRISPR-associated endonuclease/helicase Cas3
MNFAKSFRELTGHSPMRWQERLFESLRKGTIPDQLDLPTGLGKTSTMAIWLLARAAGTPLPRRLVYIVDRRAVVDQATAVADLLAERLADGADANEIVTELRVGLGLAPGKRLPVSTLRGQHADNRAWLESPSSTAIIVGTVDMIGSRLLFEGYGVSSRMRPVHAALLASDALVVLDEAHLVPPFEDLLRSAAAVPRKAPVPQMHVLTLSATGRQTPNANVFRLNADDERDERTVARLRAVKRLQLETVTGELAPLLSARAIERAAGSRRVIVFCNSRRVAQLVANEIRKRSSKTDPAPALLVGARRVREREALKDDPVFRRFLPQAGDPPADAPAYLVATSAGEVGVDLDADDLVCDLVPWERMVQRLGRVNRRADPGEALIDVFAMIPEKESESKADVELLERWRAPFVSARWPEAKNGRRDASPAALASLRDDAELAVLLREATTPEPYRPDLTSAVLEAWAMTSLEEHPGRPLVAPWLRGWIEQEPQTVLAWRQLIPRGGDGQPAPHQQLNEFFAVAAPHLVESLEAPTHQIVDVLRKRAVAWLKRPENVEGEVPFVVVLDSRNRVVDDVFTPEMLAESKTDALHRAFAGRTLVIDARLGGLDDDGLLDDKESRTPPTLDGDPAVWGSTDIGFRVRIAGRSDRIKDWPVEYRWSSDRESDGEEQEELRVEVRRSDSAMLGDPAIARASQSLAEHQRDAGTEARKLARELSLATDFELMLVASAEAHDEGKARALWQNAMGAPSDGRPFAKTTGRGSPRALEIGGVTYRHEFGSLANAAQLESIRTLREDLRELALHLIASHHGQARPVIAAVDPDYPPSVSAKRAQEIALRYVRLQSEWGVFGLAWWEALLRASDWAASRALNQKEEAR